MGLVRGTIRAPSEMVQITRVQGAMSVKLLGPPEVFMTHWVEERKRRMPCLDDKCPWCRGGPRESEVKAYFPAAVVRFGGGKYHVERLTVLELPEAPAGRAMTLEGVLDLRRTGNNIAVREAGHLVWDHGQKRDVAPPFDRVPVVFPVLPELLRVWGLRKEELA